ncbi:MAG: universal stress protein [Chitinophaga sp.]|uniref:universal stress protein n=1 Tax=Chitinophaga sp. TaxID=1869181 RepID=UPI001B0ADC9A|nr:universal stress protein [Chitinophaga sp.]MBO9729848.1 universal stress protein [Chitinophaga sp.]
MEKILFISDAVTMNRECLDFSCYLGNLTHSKVTGVFLENQELELRSAEAIEEIAVCAPVPGAPLDIQKQLYRDENIVLFRSICESNGVNCEIHKNVGMPAAEVLRESRYADLLVIDAATSFSWKPESTPTAFVKEVLEKSECPVVIAPLAFDGIEEIVFTYNGSPSAMFAIKQFTHLFPAYRHTKVTVLSIVDTGKQIKGDKAKLEEWLAVHYEHATLMVLEDTSVSGRLMEYLFNRERTFMVMGAYGRNLLSKLVQPNPAQPILKLSTQPIFISHY